MYLLVNYFSTLSILFYSPLLGGCYVYDGCVNLLHTQVGGNCGYIRCELWLYQV